VSVRISPDNYRHLMIQLTSRQIEQGPGHSPVLRPIRCGRRETDEDQGGPATKLPRKYY